MPESIEPFTIDVDDATLQDLKERLARTRIPDELPHIGIGFTYTSNCFAHVGLRVSDVGSALLRFVIRACVLGATLLVSRSHERIMPFSIRRR